MSNYISAEMPEENKAEALQLIARLREIFSFGIKLTKDQKSMMTKVDDNRISFVEKGVQFGRQEARIVPPFTDLDEYDRDIRLLKDTGQIEDELISLTEMVSDTRIGAGTDAFQAALSIYNSAKGAVKMGIPGTQAIVDEMGKLFAGQGKAKGTTAS